MAKAIVKKADYIFITALKSGAIQNKKKCNSQKVTAIIN
jgi:hypothetical protein